MASSHFGISLTVEVAFQNNAFVLDSPTLGVLDTNKLHPDWVFTDISSYVKSFDTNMGRQRNLERFSAGTATFTLDDSVDRRFDPNNAAGAYYPNVRPGIPIKVTATYNAVTYPVWWGF